MKSRRGGGPDSQVDYELVNASSRANVDSIKIYAMTEILRGVLVNVRTTDGPRASFEGALDSR